MSKTLILNKRQLDEIVGSDSSYLDNMEGDSPEFNGNTEVGTGGKLTDRNDSKPVTTDKIAHSMSRNNDWNGNGRGYNSSRSPIPLTCSKKKLVSEENSQGKNKTWKIPDNIYAQLYQNLQSFNGDKNAEGYDRLNNLLKNRNIGYNEMKRLKNYFDTNNNDNPYENVIGGNEMKNWVNQSLSSWRGGIESDKKNRKNMGMENAYQKAGGTKISGNGKAHTPKNNAITYEQ